jgi:hypothetical protein
MYCYKIRILVSQNNNIMANKLAEAKMSVNDDIGKRKKKSSKKEVKMESQAKPAKSKTVETFGQFMQEAEKKGSPKKGELGSKERPMFMGGLRAVKENEKEDTFEDFMKRAKQKGSPKKGELGSEERPMHLYK